MYVERRRFISRERERASYRVVGPRYLRSEVVVNPARERCRLPEEMRLFEMLAACSFEEMRAPGLCLVNRATPMEVMTMPDAWNGMDGRDDGTR